MSKIAKMDKDMISLMEETLAKSDLSSLCEVGVLSVGTLIDDSVLDGIPVFRSIVGISKCVGSVSDILFTKKLISFLIEINGVNSRDRKKAIDAWNKSTRYRVRIGEVILNMINRCDDSFKAKALSKLFYTLVLGENNPSMFLRAEKVLSSLSFMDLLSFLSIDREKYKKLGAPDIEPYIGTGLYVEESASFNSDNGCLTLGTVYNITEVGSIIYTILEKDFVDNR